jgi:exodeoxyribonuclease V gamma subunit
MLRIHFSNRLESLRDSLVTALGTATTSPFSTQHVVVPSSAMRRYLNLSIAKSHGICANVDFAYLAQWLWKQIAKVVPTVAAESPFAAAALTWRIYQLLGEATWGNFPRLEHYLKDPNDVMRYELAAEIAALFEQYITYRQDWMNAWAVGNSVTLKQASLAQLDDQAWEAELWRRISTDLGTAREHPANQFFRSLETTDAAGTNPFGLPEAVHVFCLPDMPPLYLEVLKRLGRWVDVTLYVLNPCREYWFEIVDPKRLRALALRGAATHHETGNRLLASWGRQTQAHIELLLERADDAPLDDDGFDDTFPATTLGRLQHAIFTLTELAPASLAKDPTDRSIEVHVCHSLTRQLEALQDTLLSLFAGPSPPRPDEILVVMPDLEAAAPLIEAVFGNVPDDRRLPFAITGRGSGANAAARAFVSLLAILHSRFAASALIELLQQPLIGRRFGIAADELGFIADWLDASGIRWGLDVAHRDELGVPGTERFTVADGLDRLFLGYALPQSVSAPTFERIPAGNPEGSSADILGAFAEFVEHLTALRADLREPRKPGAWLEVLLALLDTSLAPTTDDVDDITEVREAFRELHDQMRRGSLESPVPLAVVRAALESSMNDAARGGVPTGSITFSSMSSLRNLPFRFIGILGLDDGAFPSAARPREFDLMTADPRRGDRQRRLDDRNLFLDLILAARERLYLSYTGRSIRDNSVRPPSVVVAELIETLLPALSRNHLIIEHPLQAFAPIYFRDDPRRRSFNRELCAALDHHRSKDTAPLTEVGAPADVNDPDDEDESPRSATRFFTVPLIAPGPEWRQVSLDQLLEFFRNPCAYLLKRRLGLSLYREEDGVADEEPFIPDFLPRQALAERLLPQAMQGLGADDLRRLAQAGIEYPPGALGSAALDEEMGYLQRFAYAVRDATPVAPEPLSVELPFSLDGEPWQLAALLTARHESGLVLHRYDDTRPTDYLAAWLTHLTAAAASPTPIDTRWISRDGSFRLTPVSDAREILERLMLLYRRGLREPIHFFPKSAWEYIVEDRDLDKARAVWHKTFGDAHGEDTHEAYRLALRGVDPLDAEFETCAETVFGTARTYLDDPRV